MFYLNLMFYLKNNPYLSKFISQVEKSLEKENQGLANFTICVDEDMTKTH